TILESFTLIPPSRRPTIFPYTTLFRSCRAEADWLIGLNVTRALTTKYDDPLSAGRVQTPSLAMIMDREKEIQDFVPKEYWTIQADRKSTRLNSSHVKISYAVFCLKKKK